MRNTRCLWKGTKGVYNSLKIALVSSETLGDFDGKNSIKVVANTSHAGFIGSHGGFIDSMTRGRFLSNILC